MFHFQEITPTVLISLGDNRTGSDAAYRCTGRCRVINPMMCPVSFEDRVETGVRKTGCDPEKVQRCFQERLAKLFPSSSKYSKILSWVKGIATKSLP